MPTPYHESVAAEIRRELARQHRSQTELAAALGVSPPYLSRRLNGQVSFSLADIEQIAGILGLARNQLLEPPFVAAREAS